MSVQRRALWVLVIFSVAWIALSITLYHQYTAKTTLYAVNNGLQPDHEEPRGYAKKFTLRNISIASMVVNSTITLEQTQALITGPGQVNHIQVKILPLARETTIHPDAITPPNPASSQQHSKPHPAIHISPPRTKISHLQLLSESNTTIHHWPFLETMPILELCKRRNFYGLGPLPTASVIITFVDAEKPENILRLLDSIVIRTPRDLLQEVILVNDGSTKDELGEELSYAINETYGSIVRIYRFHGNKGMIRARLKGAEIATGDVLVFLDSHMEVQPLWLEPLLYDIKQNKTNLVAGHVDWINEVIGDQRYKWKYKHGSSFFITVFDWEFDFQFQSLHVDMMNSRPDPTHSYESPMFMGANYAIDRDYFFSVGAFDGAMMYWGYENVDLSIRTWCCGGRVLMTPCSRVAHMEESHQRDYRSRFPEILIERNAKRIVEVWMDEFKSNFYQFNTRTLNIPAGDLGERKQIRDKCPHDFSWYLKHAHPVLDVPQHGIAFGLLKNVASSCCLHSSKGKRYSALISTCSTSNIHQSFTLTANRELRQSVYVMMLREEWMSTGRDLRLEKWNMAEFLYNSPKHVTKWLHIQGGQLKIEKYDLCLEAVKQKSISDQCASVLLTPCQDNHEPQMWMFSNYTNLYPP